jgi:hypothetical protein
VRRLSLLLALAASLSALAAVAQAASPSVTARQATAAFKSHLAAVYGRHYSRAGRRWALCPRAELFPRPAAGAVAYCMAEFRYGRRWRFVEGSVIARPSGMRADFAFERTWIRRWRRSPASCTRSWGVTGRLYTNDGACDGDMAGDLERAMRAHQSTRRAFVHGTNMAGFQKVGEYRCRRHGVTVACVNGMGDAFRVVG